MTSCGTATAFQLQVLLLGYLFASSITAFHVVRNPSATVFPRATVGVNALERGFYGTLLSQTTLFYEPKWKKKETLADQLGPVKDLKEVGLVGTIAVVFNQGNETRRTMAVPGQPLREVAIQAGQFIKYGCGKGECGTCEALVNGRWIRPCSTVVPADWSSTEDYVVQVKSVKNKAKSSGKFYSVRSFLFGFYNNVLGMIGMAKYKRNAKKNWEERMEYEDLIRQKTMERKLSRVPSSESSPTTLKIGSKSKLAP